MNPVDVTSFKNMRKTREGNYESSENFEIEVLAEGAPDKLLIVPEKSTGTKKPLKTIYEVIDDNYFGQYDMKFQKEFLLK